MNEGSEGEVSQQRIRLLCVGFGSYWLDHWRARPEIEIAGIVDHDNDKESEVERSRRIANHIGAQIYTSVDHALDNVQPDMVTMVTPSDQKTDLHEVEKIVRRGFDLYLEKFRPSNRMDGRKLLELSQVTGRHIAIGESYRYDAVVQHAKQVVQSGLLGQIEQMVWRCHRPTLAADWMSSYEHVMLEDLSYHHFGVIHELLGLERFSNVFACSRLPTWTRSPSPSVVSLLAEGESGIHLNYYSSWAAHGSPTAWLGEFRIEGSEGMLELKNTALIFTDRDGNEQRFEPAVPLPYELRAGIVDEYIRAQLESRRSVLDIGCFYPVIHFIYAALESSDKGSSVNLNF